jgi:hypothetical protein
MSAPAPATLMIQYAGVRITVDFLGSPGGTRVVSGSWVDNVAPPLGAATCRAKGRRYNGGVVQAFCEHYTSTTLAWFDFLPRQSFACHNAFPFSVWYP